MNRISFLLLVCTLLFLISSCEKDDLCIPEEAATPRLIIIFTDRNNELIRKPVESLQVIERDSETPAPLNEMGAQTLTAVDSIAIPLRIESGTTQYFFQRTLNGTQNRDAINFSYTVGEEYINRACGFKAIYTNLSAEQEAETPPEQWIRVVNVRNPSVTSNQDIHVEIRH